MAGFITGLSLLLLTGCAATQPPLPNSLGHAERLHPGDSIIVGQVITGLLGPTTPDYSPKLLFLELINSRMHDRVRIDVDSDEGWFILPLPPGGYEFARLQIAEGGFLANAGLRSHFDVREGITYVGTWRLGVEPPQYDDRTVLISVVIENEALIRNMLVPDYPVGDRPLAANLLRPATAQTRLYEVPPYPRFWWFRRHHTS